MFQYVCGPSSSLAKEHRPYFWFKVSIRAQNATIWDTTYAMRLLLIWFFHYSFHTIHRYSVEFYVRLMHVCVSADDMGLGKTLSMIALVLKAKEEIENEGVSEEDSDDENESTWHSEKQTCKYYCTFLRQFHFLQFYDLYNSQNISILPELTSFLHALASIHATPLRLTSSYLASWLFRFPFLYSSSPLSSCFYSVLKLVHAFLFCYVLLYFSRPFVFKLSSGSYLILINLVTPMLLKVSSLLLLVYWCPEM